MEVLLARSAESRRIGHESGLVVMARKKNRDNSPQELFSPAEKPPRRAETESAASPPGESAASPIGEGGEPLASRMRPRTLEEFVGQEEILAPGSLLRKAIETDRLSSLILYGPPGCGKTTLAHCISSATHAHFAPVNAVTSNVQELRRVIKEAKVRRAGAGRKTILFIDEIHRFNKAQQDVLMPDIEDGSVTLIGATVLNPFFVLTAPLLSRSLIFEFKALAEENVVTLLKRALADKERGLGAWKIAVEPAALRYLARVTEGDARRSLNALEVGVKAKLKAPGTSVRFTLKDARESVQRKAVVYDRDDDAHYDTISAFIKSMRGSDPDAALYWMAKMLYAGEDPRFIARRIVICAAEDVGNADPQALVLAEAALGAAEFVGMPEARIPLAQAAVYVACAPKSNAAYLGIERALRDVKEGRVLDVPQHLRDASYRSAGKLGRGAGYKYPHDFPGHFVDQEYLPAPRVYYEPQDLGYEKKIKERLNSLRSRK
ncbi:MAG: AAA family ATPase [Deltaproteobacteria bacterium]